MEIDKIATLNPAPDDTILVSFDGRLTEQNIDYLRKQMKIAFPDNKCLVVEGSLSVEIALKWTSDLPTQEGWYWLKYELEGKIEFEYVKIDNSAGNLYVSFIGTNNFEPIKTMCKDNEWYGPIEPPEYA